jgi:hypothetical protein
MIIGLLGFAGSGKGTAADILVSKGFKKESFADPVKDAVAAIFSWDRNMLEGDTSESRRFRETKDEWWSNKFGYDVTPRYMLQLMGTEAGRNTFHDKLWIHSMEKRLEKNEHTVIADVRFANECDFIRSKGGFIVRVVRGKEPKWYDDAKLANDFGFNSMPSYPDIHYSEWAWIGQKLDYLLDNNGSIIMLEGGMKHMLKCFVGPDIMNTQMAS